MQIIPCIISAFLFTACQGGIGGTDDGETDAQDAPDSTDSLTDQTVDPADVIEEPKDCTSNSECLDDNPCNGEETCNMDTHRCVSGVPPPDGFECGESPRSICLDAECRESVCGDGFVDAGSGEFCEPPGEGSCNHDCTQWCDGNEDCDDANPCTNDLCDGGTCSRSYVADGTSCGEGVVCCSGACVECCTSEHCTGGLAHCCEGQCRACCIDTDCDDTISCTEDACNEYLCSHTDLPDLTPCPGGICCGARCRLGGNCCSDAQCMEGCKGTARPCREISGGLCSSQVGCHGGGEAYCEGDPYRCWEGWYNPETCLACGCVWGMGECEGFFPTACAALEGEICEACGCTWHAGCDGAHEACTTYSDQTTCDTQLDCYWSTCLEYLCT